MFLLLVLVWFLKVYILVVVCIHFLVHCFTCFLLLNVSMLNELTAEKLKTTVFLHVAFKRGPV